MRIFKYKTYGKWAKKQGMSDVDLKKAITEIEKGLINENLEVMYTKNE